MTPMTIFLIAFPGMALTGIFVPLLAARWFAAPLDRKRTEWTLVVFALVQPAGILTQLIANSLSILLPKKIDLYIYRIDLFFGAPSFWLGKIVVHHLWLAIITSIAYGLLPIAVAGVFSAYLYLRTDCEALNVLAAFAINSVVALPFYFLFPAAGPIYAFLSFPDLPPVNLIPHLIAISAAPNCIPSVHMSTALLVLWFLRKWGWGRVVGSVYAILVAMATIGSGQHYFIDLVVAVPFAAAVVYSTRKLFLFPRRTDHAETN